MNEIYDCRLQLPVESLEFCVWFNLCVAIDDERKNVLLITADPLGSGKDVKTVRGIQAYKAQKESGDRIGSHQIRVVRQYLL